MYVIDYVISVESESLLKVSAFAFMCAYMCARRRTQIPTHDRRYNDPLAPKSSRVAGRAFRRAIAGYGEELWPHTYGIP